jgi:uncharacterized protein (DUF58 family)
MKLVPRTPLLLWFACVALPLAALAAMATPAAFPALCALAIFLLIIASDAVASRAALAGLKVELPAVVRLQKERDGEIAIRIQNIARTRRVLRLGIPFPPEITSTSEELLVELAPGAEFSTAAWPCRPLKRGRYTLTRCHVEAASPLRLWAARAVLPAESELRVYPNFMDERKHVAALFLNRGHLGIHAQRQSGKGREFEKLREYIPGDSYEDIHWKASAKRGRPVTKIFQVERTQEVYVVLDASRLMARESAGFERCITAGLLLGVAAEQQGDAFGLLAFSNRILHFARAKAGPAQFAACREMLYGLQPSAVTPDFQELTTFIRTRLRKRALLIFLTALDDPAISESFLHSMDLICRQHLILVNMVQPPGVRPLFGNPAVRNTDEIYTELGGHLIWHDLRELGKVLQRRGVRMNLLEQEALTARLVSQYVNVKAMQLL